jgi:SagB-type dehydrogenase family enzyme
MSKGIGQEFMDKTRYEEMGKSLQQQGLPQPPLELPYPEGVELIPLPTPSEVKIPALDLRTAIERRKTVRKYQDKPLTMAELSFLLWTTQGIREVISRPVTMRNVPSAGARHAFETYILVNRVMPLTPGLYRFIATKHALLPVTLNATIMAEIMHACLDQAQIEGSAVTFIWDAVVERMFWRYNERGYRYLHLDAGIVGQNLALAAEAIDCGVCAIGAFNDDLLNKAIGLDGETQFVIYATTVGKR